MEIVFGNEFGCMMSVAYEFHFLGVLHYFNDIFRMEFFNPLLYLFCSYSGLILVELFIQRVRVLLTEFVYFLNYLEIILYNWNKIMHLK